MTRSRDGRTFPHRLRQCQLKLATISFFTVSLLCGQLLRVLLRDISVVDLRLLSSAAILRHAARMSCHLSLPSGGTTADTRVFEHRTHAMPCFCKVASLLRRSLR